jgi:hypothetical protein
VTAASGAGEVSLEGRDRSGVAGRSVFTTPGLAPGAAGLDTDALAGAGGIAVTARPRLASGCTAPLAGNRAPVLTAGR